MDINLDLKELSKVFINTTSVLSKSFDKLNSLDLSVNTKGLQKALDGLQGNFEGTSMVMGKSLRLMKDSIDVSADFMNNTEGIFDEIGDIQSSIRSTLDGMHNILADIEAARNNARGQGFVGNSEESGKTAGAVKNIISKVFPKSAPWINLAGKILGFDSGGIVPGSFSQPVPVIAHGSEMILNPGQQAKLFKMLDGQGQGHGGQSHQTYAPQVRSGVSSAEVFEILNRHNRQFFSMVAEGVQKDSSLRNAVKGT